MDQDSLDRQFSDLRVENARNVSGGSLPVIEVEEEEDDEPFSLKFFSIYCLFEDLHNMRVFASGSVTDYLQGKIDLVR